MELKSQIVNGLSSSASQPIKGSYELRRFVLRLAPEIHDILFVEDGEPEVRIETRNFGQAQAFSTYLHETIHWWQHIGSFAGFVQTSLFPAISHLNHDGLLKVIKATGPQKPLIRFLEKNYSALSPALVKDLNVITNNYMDLKHFQSATQDPRSLVRLGENKFFEGRGHCSMIAYMALLSSMSPFDRKFEALPDPKSLEEALNSLKEKRKIEFYHGSPIRCPPIGLHEIFEGQARFCQMQYLFYGSGQKLSWSEFDNAGMLGKVYVSAFNLFLNLLDIPWPENLGSPEIFMFLLICDISINPTDGFPLTMRSPETFVDDVDPGTRFLALCLAARDQPAMLSAIRQPNRSAYEAVSEALCNRAGLVPPHFGVNRITTWKDKSEEINRIVVEGAEWEFGAKNMPLRLLLSKFISFNEDKYRFPEFFCWPGASMATPNLHEHSQVLFQKHQSLFADRPDKRGVYPRLMTGVDSSKYSPILDSFYSWIVLYDIVNQWIGEEGRFDLAFDWLSDKSNEEIFQWANENFAKIYGVRPEHFTIIEKFV